MTLRDVFLVGALLTIAGHSLRDVSAILDAHGLHRDQPGRAGDPN
jgi:hypothetical protein